MFGLFEDKDPNKKKKRSRADRMYGMEQARKKRIKEEKHNGTYEYQPFERQYGSLDTFSQSSSDAGLEHNAPNLVRAVYKTRDRVKNIEGSVSNIEEKMSILLDKYNELEKQYTDLKNILTTSVAK